MFRYHNENPNGYHVPDCVVRAIKLALDIPYYDVVMMLQLNGDYYDCDLLNKMCYEKLLDYDYKLPHYVGNGKTAEELASAFPNAVLLLRMSGHISCAIRGVIHDIWDCSEEEITDFWIVEQF
jgi:hypothetical protein